MYDYDEYLTDDEENTVPVQNGISNTNGVVPPAVVNGGRDKLAPPPPRTLKHPFCRAASANSDDSDPLFPFPIEATISDRANFVPAYDSVFKDVDYRVIFGHAVRNRTDSNASDNAEFGQKVANYAVSSLKNVLPGSFSCSTLSDFSVNGDKRQIPSTVATSSFKPLKETRFDSIDVVDLISDDDDSLDGYVELGEIQLKDLNLDKEVSDILIKPPTSTGGCTNEEAKTITAKRYLTEDFAGSLCFNKRFCRTAKGQPRFSQTLFSIEDILEKKRALREKNINSDQSGSDAASSVSEFSNQTPAFNRRDFGRAFSPTVYSSEQLQYQTMEDIQSTITADIYEFLRVLLSLNVAALNADYQEVVILHHLKTEGMLRYDFNWNDEMPLSYASLNDYKMAYLPFIMLDGWAQIVDSLAGTYFRKLKMFVRNADMKEDDNFITFWLKGLVASSEVHLAKFGLENWMVLVFPETDEGGPSRAEAKQPTSETSNKMALGFVQLYFNKMDVYSDRASAPKHLNVLGNYDPDTKGSSLTAIEYVVKVAKNETTMKLFADKKSLSLIPLYYFRPTIRYVETLSMMKLKNDFVGTFLQPKEEVFKQDFTRPDGFEFFEENSYNKEQKNAIVSCYNAVQQPYTKNKVVMIQGPPGTGKTHTLVGIVKNMFINCKTSKSKPLRILICAPSNGAIDEIALRLIRDREFLKQFKEYKLRIVRIGQRSQVHPDVKKYLLDNLVDSNFNFCQKTRSKGELREELLMNANVILSTLNSAQLSCMSMFRAENISSQKAIRCVIVDECSQSTEPEVFMPMIYPVSKLILIGDHLQLPATVISRCGLRAGYGRSMFERLYRHFESTMGDRTPMLTLTQQFRMHRSICAFPSKHFYKGVLETPANTGLNPAISLQQYFLFDVVNANEQQTSSQANASRFNIEEVQFIFKLLLVIFNKLGFNVTQESIGNLPPTRIKIKIGVITFYRGQKLELVKKLEQFHDGALLTHVDVNTVDAFQGQERDITILSCVRAFDPTNDNNSVGFVRSQQRMNVALTRSKSVLYICLHGKSFTNVPRWQQLLDDAMQRKRFVRITSKVPDEKLSKLISLVPKQ